MDKEKAMQHSHSGARTRTRNRKIDREPGDMPLPREDVEATTPKFLRDKYAIVGVGETSYTRGSDKSTRALASIAVRNAIGRRGTQTF